MNNIQELVPFNAACDEFATGKYLLADIKISSILQIIEADEKLKNIVSSCTENYNFSISAINSIIKDDATAYFSMPKAEKEVIAFVYNLLNSFKNNSINFYDFLSRFYPSEVANADFDKFAKEVVLPFKDSVNSIYSKRHILVETNDYQNNIYNKIKTNIKLIFSNIDSFKLKISEKEEFTMLLNSLYFASEKNDKKLVYSIMIGLDYFSKANKRTRSAYLSLEECFA